MANVGLTTEILDGKLNPKTRIPDGVVLVIDRAYDGPSDEVFVVTDSEVAKALYGTNSPIIHGMRHAYAGGAKTVALYRVGGSGAVVNNIFGNYTRIETTSNKFGAGADIKVYAGPRVTNPEKSTIVVTQGTKIVYSNAPGREIDLGVVNVEGFDTDTFSYQIGTLSQPVLLAELVNNVSKKGSETFTATASQTTFTLTNTATQVVGVTKTVGATTSVIPSTDYTLVGTAGAYTAVTLTVGAGEDDVIEIQTLTKLTPEEITENEISFTPAKDSMNVSLNKLYELFDSAFVNLENVDIFSVILPDLFNVRNIVDGADDSTDRLTFVKRTETETGYTYKWSDFKNIYQLASDPTLTTTDPDLASVDDLGQPIIKEQFNEVDFAHRLGMWAYLQSSSSTFVNANIGAKPPAANYTIAINRWLGKAPTKDIYGNIIENGTGLLGNRFIAGTTNRKAGFYATTNGYPDGDPRLDSGDVLIDLGKYLSINVMPVYLTAESFSGNQVNVRSASGVYAGLVSTITVGDSTTNQILPSVTTLFKLKQTQIEALSNAGYVALEEKTKGLTVYSGDLATQSDSDYDYISTAIAVTYVVNRLKVITDPYLGRGISSTLMAALYNAIDVELKSAVTLGYINGYSFNLIGRSAHELALPLTLQAKGELRAISMTLALSENALISL